MKAIGERFGTRLVALAHVCDREPGTLANARIAYQRSDNPNDGYVVHAAICHEDGSLSLAHGNYDLTRDAAVRFCVYATPAR